MAIEHSCSLFPDGHLWSNPEEKLPLPVTRLMAIFGRDGRKAPRAWTGYADFRGSFARWTQRFKSLARKNLTLPRGVLNIE